jgi:hypothetical protein
VKPLIGRRPLFFLLLGAVCMALLPPTPSEFRWVNLVMAGLALFWAVMLAGEDVARRRRPRRDPSADADPPGGRA